MPWTSKNFTPATSILIILTVIFFFMLLLSNEARQYERSLRTYTSETRAQIKGCLTLRPTDRICVSTASFRDSRCKETIRQMFLKADRPEDIVALICEQNGQVADEPPNYESCLTGPVEIGEVRVISIPASMATGPCTARARCASLWQGEAIFLQIDAHTFFSQSWDTVARRMIANAPHDKCIFSTYAIDSNKDEGTYLDRDVPTINDLWKYTDKGVLQQATAWHSPGETPPSRSIGGGFILAPGKVLADVPLDPHLDWLFQTEESLWAARLYTHGYDLFSPSHNLVAHAYDRKAEELPLHPEKMDFGKGDDHAFSIFGQTFESENSRKSRDNGYNIGTERTLEEFWEYINFNPLTGVVDEHPEWPKK